MKSASEIIVRRSARPIKTEVCSVVLLKRTIGNITTLELVYDQPAAQLREVAVYTHVNKWLVHGERVLRNIGQFVRRMFLRRFALDPHQVSKVLGVYDPNNERLMGKVLRQIRRFQRAIEQYQTVWSVALTV